jgi:hypothetical protein
MLDCHPEAAQKKMMELLEAQQLHAYTVEKNGVKTMLCQSSWYED